MLWELAWRDLAVFFEVHEVFALGVLAVAALALLPRQKIFLQSLVLTILVTWILKIFFAEPRPCVLVPGMVPCPSDFGFPSLHSALAGLFLMGSLGSRLAFVVIPLALVLAYSRVFIGVHTFGQVIAGFALGIVVYLFVWRYVGGKRWPRKNSLR